jgi:VanZ family protein
LIIFYRVALFFSLLAVIYLAGIEIKVAELELPYVDKILHFIAFFFLTGLMDLSIKTSLKLRKMPTIFLIFYAGAIEVMQFYIPYRSAELFDLLAGLLGILVYFVIIPKIKEIN